MPLPTTFFAALSALAAAVTWGAGDFAGGLAARRSGPFRSVLIAYSVGLIVMVIVALGAGESYPRRQTWAGAHWPGLPE